MEEGVAIGDVGILHENGAFDFLFSICRGDRNQYGVPDGFQLLDEPFGIIDDSNYLPPPSVVSSPGTTRYSVKIRR